jgi:predicted HAD superfamily Cof-like phosphohydrolase
MDDLKEFHNTFSPKQHDDDFLAKTDRRFRLMYEEYGEAVDALAHLEGTYEAGADTKKATEELAKELADLLYVVYGTAEELGIPLEHVFHEVHKSNMSKSNPDGTVSRNDFGKVLKPPTYVKPDLSFIHDNSLL